MTRVLGWTLGLVLVIAAMPGELRASLDGDPAEIFVGRWKRDPVSERSPDVDIELVGPRRLAFKAMHDDWRGTFDPDAAGRARIAFERAPTPDQMDHAVPLWARERVAGTLKWRLEVELDECASPPRLAAKWFKGEIEWRERTRPGAPPEREARVSGPGEAVDIAFVAHAREAEAFAEADAPVILTVTPATAPLSTVSIPSVVQAQPLHVTVRMGAKQAERAGASISVTLKAQTSGKSTTVSLRRYSGAAALPVIYTTDYPIVLDDPWSGTVGYTDLGVSNGETIVATYEDFSAKFEIYDSPIQLGIAEHSATFERLTTFYSALLTQPGMSQHDRQNASDKLALVRNVRRFLEHVPAADEPFTDYNRIEAAETYHRLLQEDTSAFSRIAGGSLVPRFGMVMLFAEERDAFAESQRRAQERFRNRLIFLASDLTVGFYDFFVDMTVAGQFVAVVWGIDKHGKRISRTDRLLAGIDLASQILLVGATTAQQVRGLNRTSLEQSHARAIERWHEHRRQQAAATSRPVGAGGKRAPGWVEGPSAGGASRPPVSPIATNDDFPFERWAGEPEFAAGGFVDRALVDRAKPLTGQGTPLQFADDTCGLMTAEGMLRDAGFPYVREQAVVDFAFKNFMFGKGMTVDDLMAYLEFHGAVASTLVKPTVDQLARQLRRGRSVGVMIKSGAHGSNAAHWVRFEGMSCSNGRAFVHMGDPWTGGSWRVRADLFQRRIVSSVSADFSKADVKVRPGG